MRRTAEAIVALWNDARPERPPIRVTPGRVKKVRARLRDGFTEEQLAVAVRNLLASRFHMGENDRRWAAPGPEWALSSQEKAEEWVNKQPQPERRFCEPPKFS